MLTPRQTLILQIVIDDYIRSAQPVGSRILSKNDAVSFSSATIRNEMADLEEMGYLEKTHISSGRVPSEKGYRFYVDNLLAPQTLEAEDAQAIGSIFTEQIFELEKVVQKSANILSDLTHYTTIALGPKVKANKLRSIQLIPVGLQKAVVIIVTDTGIVKNKTITTPEGVDVFDLEKMIKILNERLVGVPISDLQARIVIEVANVLRAQVENYEGIVGVMNDILTEQKDQKVFTSGKTNMLLQPEFHDIQKFHSLLSTFKNEEGLRGMLSQQKNGIHVMIGRETAVTGMENCSLITATYALSGKEFGTIAILGPTRMEYSRVISLLQGITGGLSNLFNELGGEVHD